MDKTHAKKRRVVKTKVLGYDPRCLLKNQTITWTKEIKFPDISKYEKVIEKNI
jgi:hypothetical protein